MSGGNNKWWSPVTKTAMCALRWRNDKIHCGSMTQWVLVLRKSRNGVVNALWVCGTCGSWLPGATPIKHQEALALCRSYGCKPSDLPHIAINDFTTTELNECSVVGCRNTDLELHHWAPTSYFARGWDWPVSYLCHDHHREWHRVSGIAYKNYEASEFSKELTNGEVSDAQTPQAVSTHSQARS